LCYFQTRFYFPVSSFKGFSVVAIVLQIDVVKSRRRREKRDGEEEEEWMGIPPSREAVSPLLLGWCIYRC
jgi:hypothetical protein